MALRAVILERIVLSVLLTLVAILMKPSILSTHAAPNLGLEVIQNMNLVAALETYWQEENLTNPDYQTCAVESPWL